MPTFKCKRCKACFSQKGQLNRHMKYHVAPTFKCRVCDKYYYQRSDAEVHEKRQHFGFTDKCVECGVIFGSRFSYRAHECSNSTNRRRYLITNNEGEQEKCASLNAVKRRKQVLEMQQFIIAPQEPPQQPQAVPEAAQEQQQRCKCQCCVHQTDEAADEALRGMILLAAASSE